MERRARKLNSSGENDQFDLVECKLSDRFGWSETSIRDGDEIGYGTGPEVTFSVPQTKNIGGLCRNHLVQGIGIEANLVVGEIDLIEQVAGSGEWRVATQHDGVEGSDQSG